MSNIINSFELGPAVSFAIVGILLLSLFITINAAIKRLSGHSTMRKSMVALLNVVAVIALIGLIFGFQMNTQKRSSLVLITPNSTQQAIDEVMKGTNDSELTWVILSSKATETQPTILRMLENKSPITLYDITQLPLYVPRLLNMSSLHIVGDGLSPSQWRSLLVTSKSQQGSQALNALQSTWLIKHSGFTPLLGFTNMQWPKQLIIGQQATITGTLQTSNNLDNEINPALYQLQLLDPMGNEIESQLLAANENFSFTITAQIPGQWQYQLVLSERAQQSPLLSENMSMQVAKAAPVKLLIKQSAPSFETRHLQNALGEQGAKLVSLTQISKNKDIRQQVNLNTVEKATLEAPFSKAGLAFFDLLIIDQTALAGLSSEHASNLQNAIEEGLGVIVQAQSQNIKNWPNDKFLWLAKINLLDIAGSQSSKKEQYLSWQYQQLDTPLSSIAAQIQGEGLEYLVVNQDQQALVASHEYALGTVAVSLINTSHSWKTQGKPHLHSQYWQWLFSQIARANSRPYWIDSASSSAPIIAGQTDEKCIVNLSNNADVQFIQKQQSMPLTAASQLIDANTQCIHYVAQQTGWFSLTAKPLGESNKETSPKGATSINLYANNPKQWQAWQQQLRYKATQKTIQQQSPTNISYNINNIPISPYWFWILLMGSLSILWVERKW